MRVGIGVAMVVVVLATSGVASAESTDGHHGVTAEVGVGAELTILAAPVVSAGVGGWLTPRTALTGRAFGMMSETSETEGYRTYELFVGPAFQYWVNRGLWLGYGAGYCQLHEETIGATPRSQTTYRGVELDLRIGGAATIAPHHTVNLSLELRAGLMLYETSPPDGTLDPSGTMAVARPFLGLTFGAGYQYL
jgi:hypothetical protein